MEAYYYTHMNKVEQSVYHGMKAGLSAMSPSFLIPRLEIREIGEIFFKLRLDWPELFYAVGFRCRSYPDSGNLELIPEYLFDKGKVKEHQRAMKARVEKLIRPAQSMTEWEKERYVHDFICSGVRYDKLKKPYSHEIIGPLGQGVGVCEGIAKSVKILLDGLGIWNMIAVSDANPDKKIKYRHAWNIVRIGGTYYHLDATFDNSLGQGDVIRYDYFNLDDRRFFRDHEPVMYQTPACGDGDHFYYKEKKLSFTKMEEVGRRAGQAVKKNRLFVFHWRGGYLTRPVLDELLRVLEQEARERDKHVRVSLNWSQAVFQAAFTGELPSEELVVEEANEGEKA